MELRIGCNFRTQIILELELLGIQSVFVYICFCFQVGIPEIILELVVGNRLPPFSAGDRFADDTARLDRLMVFSGFPLMRPRTI